MPSDLTAMITSDNSTVGTSMFPPNKSGGAGEHMRLSW